MHCLWCQLSTTCSNAAEVAQLATFNCSRPQKATNNSVSDGRFNLLAVNPTLMGSTKVVPPQRLDRARYKSV